MKIIHLPSHLVQKDIFKYIDKLIDEYYKEENKDKKRLIYAELIQLVNSEYMYIPLFFINVDFS